MENIEEKNQESRRIEVFHEYLPDAEIHEVEYDDIPDDAMERFERYSRRFIPPEKISLGNFDSLWKVQFENEDIAFIAEQEKDYEDEDKNVEKNVYLYEKRGEHKIGHGEMRLLWSTEREDIRPKRHPFVGFTKTNVEFNFPLTEENYDNPRIDYRRQGLGRRRLFIMNAYSMMQFGLPLHSGNPDDTSKRIWERLVDEGIAETFEYDGAIAYRFIVKK